MRLGALVVAAAVVLLLLKGTMWEAPFLKFRKMMIKGGRDGMEPEAVGRIIAKALTIANPKTRYRAVKGEFVSVTVPSLLKAASMLNGPSGKDFSPTVFF